MHAIYLDFLQCLVFLLRESGCAAEDVDEGVHTVRKRQQRLGDLDLYFLHVTVSVEQSRSIQNVDPTIIQLKYNGKVLCPLYAIRASEIEYSGHSPVDFFFKFM